MQMKTESRFNGLLVNFNIFQIEMFNKKSTNNVNQSRVSMYMHSCRKKCFELYIRHLFIRIWFFSEYVRIINEYVDPIAS